jgi:alcohol dehydrogenase
MIHSAAGGVGIWAGRIAKRYNAFIIGTIGDISKASKIQNEKYDVIIERNKDYRTSISAILNSRRPDIILDPVGGKYLRDGYRFLNSGGRLVTYGSANFNVGVSTPNYFKIIYKYFTRPKIDPLQMINHNKSVMGFNLIYLWDKVDEMGIYLDKMITLDLGKPVIDSIYSFENLKEALYYFQKGKSVGKIVVKL